MMSADDIDRWLASIEVEPGRLTPDLVVAAASDTASPGHGLFEWNDAKAGHLHRVAQARAILATRVKVEVRNVAASVPIYARDPNAQAGVQSYVRVVRAALPDPTRDVQHAMLLDELSRVSTLLARARTLAAFFGEDGAVDALSGGVAALRDRIERDAKPARPASRQ